MPPRYVPPHRNGASVDARYSRDQLLDFYKSQSHASAAWKDGLSDLFVGGWQPDVSEGAVVGSWGRGDQGRDAAPIAPDVCWEHDGGLEPLGLADLDDEEKEVSVNGRESTVRDVR